MMMIKKSVSVPPTCKPMTQREVNTRKMIYEAMVKYGGRRR